MGQFKKSGKKNEMHVLHAYLTMFELSFCSRKNEGGALSLPAFSAPKRDACVAFVPQAIQNRLP
jgi:hypothetical protein